MYQVFLLYCMIGAEPSIRTCNLEYSNFILEYKQVCEETLIARVEEMAPTVEEDGYYIYDVGCTEYLPEGFQL